MICKSVCKLHEHTFYKWSTSAEHVQIFSTWKHKSDFSYTLFSALHGRSTLRDHISIAEMEERVAAGVLFESLLLDRISRRAIFISSWPRRVFQKALSTDHGFYRKPIDNHVYKKSLLCFHAGHAPLKLIIWSTAPATLSKLLGIVRSSRTGPTKSTTWYRDVEKVPTHWTHSLNAYYRENGTN